MHITIITNDFDAFTFYLKLKIVTLRKLWDLHIKGFPGGSEVKESACNAGDVIDASSIPGSGRSPGGEHGNPLLYSCLENPMDRGAWWTSP